MNFETRGWKPIFWLMTWAPLIALVLGPEGWSTTRRLVVGCLISAALFVLALVVALVRGVLSE